MQNTFFEISTIIRDTITGKAEKSYLLKIKIFKNWQKAKFNLYNIIRCMTDTIFVFNFYEIL